MTPVRPWRPGMRVPIVKPNAARSPGLSGCAPSGVAGQVAAVAAMAAPVVVSVMCGGCTVKPSEVMPSDYAAGLIPVDFRRHR